MKQTIFISYSWSDSVLADKIDKIFEPTGLTIKRDIREIKFKGSIKEYMSKVRSTDFVILLISDSFLRSSNAMFEVIELLKEPTFKDKILPIIVDGTKIYNPQDRLKYIKFWKEKHSELEQSLKDVSVTDAIELYNELKHYENIRTTIDEFMRILVDMNSPKVSEAIANNFHEVFDHIGVTNKTLINDILSLHDFTTDEVRDIEIDKLETKYPNNSKVYFTKGHYAFVKQEISKSSYYYRKSIELDPTFSSSYFNLGFNLEVYDQNYQEAEKLYLKAIELEPTLGKAYSNLSILYTKLSQPEKANVYLIKALEINPFDSVAHYNLAINYFDSNNFEKAKHHYELAIKFDEDFVDAKHNLGTLLWYEFEKYDEAKLQFEEILTINPDQKNALKQIASLLELEYNDYETAKKYYERYLNTENIKAIDHYDFAVFLMLHLESKYHDLAIKHYNIALLENPELKFLETDILFRD